MNNTNFTNPLAVFNPQPFTPAGTNANTGLDGDPTRRANAAARRAAGEPLPGQPGHRQRRNFESNAGYTKYDSLQFDVTKRCRTAS